MIIEPNLPAARQLMMEGNRALAVVERNGMRVDVPRLEKTMKKLKKDIKRRGEELKESEVYEIWRRRFGKKTNLSSGPQLAAVLYEEMGFEPTEYTEKTQHLKDKSKRKPKTDAKALRQIDHPFPKQIVALESMKKTMATYLVGIHRELVGDILRPSFDLNLTRTYRGSSSKPNGQNFPNRDLVLKELVRSCFIPRKGHAIVEIDISGAEVRVAACYNKDPRLMQYILDPSKDMHRDMAAECYKIKTSQVTKAMRHVGKNSFVFPQFYGSFYVECAKNMWLAISQDGLEIDGASMKEHLKSQGINRLGDTGYGAEVEGDSFISHIKEVEAAFWNERFVRYRTWKEEWWEAYLETGSFGTLTGFQVKGDYKKLEVCNYPIQGSAFHCLLWSLSRLVLHYLPKYGMKTKVMGQIHDSILADVPLDELDDFLEIVANVMLVELDKQMDWLVIPFEIDASVSRESWFKSEEVAICV